VAPLRAVECSWPTYPRGSAQTGAVRPRSVASLLVVAALGITGCRDDAPDGEAVSTAGSTAGSTDPSSAPASPGSPSASDPSPGSASSSEAVPGASVPGVTEAPAMPSTTAAADDRLLVAVSVHVERYDGEADDRALFDAHVAVLTQLADLAEAHDVVVSYELSSEFVAAATAWDPGVVPALAARGHGVGQHSGDRGTAGLDGAALVAALADQRAAIEALGVDATYVSGACGDGAWVEAVAAAGFVGTSGLTEYCLRSLDDAHLPAGMDWIRRCTSPAVCHDPLQLDTQHLTRPWTTGESASFLTDDAAGAVVVVPTVEATGLATMSQGLDVDVTAALADWVALLDAHVAARTAGRVNCLDVTVSIGPDPDWTVLEAMFAELSSRDPAVVRSATMAEIVALAAAEAPTHPVDPPPTYVETTPDLGTDRPAGGTLPGSTAPGSLPR
jgi:hypothetical protein